MTIKQKFTLAVVSVSLLLTACGSPQPEKKNGQNGNTGSAVTKIDHLHGLTYSKDGSTLYAATHEGLISSKDEGSSWLLVGKEANDLMGFNVLPDGTMLTSGHPGQKSKLPNPLGVMVSKDQGETWEALSLQGKVDFHILAPNTQNPTIIYALNQMGEGEYGAGIYKSTDAGKTWEKVASQGLPTDLTKVVTMLSYSSDPNLLLAGTEQGVKQSQDGGKTWADYGDLRIITALQVMPNTNNELISYSLTKQKKGVMLSQDEGKSWNFLGLDLGQDAIGYFAVNPKNTNEISAASFDGNVYITKDSGKNWKMIIEKGSVKKQ
ncbi:MAG TPA: YCF48-related protein [Bacillota bacterium]|nr:YCF48-related protein [Bacillota bacterium]